MEFDKQYEETANKYGKMFLEQLELEKASKKNAEYLKELAISNKITDGKSSQTLIGQKLINSVWNSCITSMENTLNLVITPKKGVKPSYSMPMADLIRIYGVDKKHDLAEILVLTSISTMLNMCLKKTTYNSISTVANNIASVIQIEANIESYLDKTPNKTLALHKLDKAVSQRVQESYKRNYICHLLANNDIADVVWTPEQKRVLGAKLIDVIVSNTPYFDIINTDVASNSLAPSEYLLEVFRKNTEILVSHAHTFEPLVIPPKPWNDVNNGGYYGDLQPYTSLLRLQQGETNSFLKTYKKHLALTDLTYVYTCLNNLQETPFAINKEVLAVVDAIIDRDNQLGNIPQMNPLEMLPDLVGDYTEEELRKHKDKKLAIIKREISRKSKALRTLTTIGAAKKFSKYPSIYFAWNMDYRGRCYPLSTSINPQGDDLMKALLVFANPGACTKEDDFKWFCIHGANLAGHDKLPLANRVAWVKDHEKEILASANNPLEYTWWSKEAENDYPLEFLSFCFEYQKAKKWMETHNTIVGWRCSIAIAFDGTCSGLQHFSALLRDEIGGHAVNLLPTPDVQDIYSIVAEKCNEYLYKDMHNGTEDTEMHDKEGRIIYDKDNKAKIRLGTKVLANIWLSYSEAKFGSRAITRKVCKRSVMTLAYGSGKYGFKQNLLEDIIIPYNNAHPETTPFKDTSTSNQAANYLADLIWKAVSKTVVKAVEGMKYLQTLAKVIAKKGKVVTWTTPNNLPVQQNYLKEIQKEVRIMVNGVRKRIYYSETDGNIDSRKQTNGIAPNFIHSLDSTHLQRVVVASANEGNKNFAMIHDSFGTDLSHAGRLFQIIREQFVGLYENQNRLADFLNEVKYLLTEQEISKLPPIPDFGKLDLQMVKKSDFCFA